MDIKVSMLPIRGNHSFSIHLQHGKLVKIRLGSLHSICSFSLDKSGRDAHQGYYFDNLYVCRENCIAIYVNIKIIISQET